MYTEDCSYLTAFDSPNTEKRRIEHSTGIKQMDWHNQIVPYTTYLLIDWHFYLPKQ